MTLNKSLKTEHPFTCVVCIGSSFQINQIAAALLQQVFQDSVLGAYIVQGYCIHRVPSTAIPRGMAGTEGQRDITRFHLMVQYLERRGYQNDSVHLSSDGKTAPQRDVILRPVRQAAQKMRIVARSNHVHSLDHVGQEAAFHPPADDCDLPGARTAQSAGKKIGTESVPIDYLLHPPPGFR